MHSLITRLVNFYAFLGGVVLCLLGVMTAWSVIGRNLFGSPVLGDTELIQVGVGFCVAAFLPICQWRAGNIIVDFFTTKASDQTRNALDQFGAFCVGLMLLAIGYRAIYGMLSQKSAQATTMMMQIPEWWVYLTMVPALLLTALIGAYMAVTGKNGRQEGALL